MGLTEKWVDIWSP